MIISASRRTDIPAFYGDWLLRRLREGYVLVRHPYNPLQVSHVSLHPQAVDCIVFWTKNPGPLLPKLPEIARLGYRFLVQFTLNDYDHTLEPGLPPLHKRLATFRQLAEQIGPDRVLWRFDPIVFTQSYGPDAVLSSFAQLAGQLRFLTRQCTLSFLSLYAKCRRNLVNVALTEPELQEKVSFVHQLSALAQDNGISLKACCDTFLHEQGGIEAGRCIDPDLIANIIGQPLVIPKDKGQRHGCGCAASIDIGAYDTCPHGCCYCYANVSLERVRVNRQAHHPDSPLLIGALTGRERITERGVQSYRRLQKELFSSLFPPERARG